MQSATSADRKSAALVRSETSGITITLRVLSKCLLYSSRLAAIWPCVSSPARIRVLSVGSWLRPRNAAINGRKSAL